MFQKKFFVESDHRINQDFRNYKSYYLVSDPNVTEHQESIDRAINYEMELHGYRESEEPGLLVLYRIFDKDIKFVGNKDQVKTNEEETGYMPVQYKLKEGTLLIQIVDLEKHQLVWQGYASGVINNKNINTREVRRAVLMIFNKYQHFADGYLTAR